MKVWLEVERSDGKKVMHERVFDLICASDNTQAKIARFAFLRQKGETAGTEKWTFFDKVNTTIVVDKKETKLSSAIASSGTSETRSSGQGSSSSFTLWPIDVPKPINDADLLAEINKREDLSDREREVFSKEFGSKPKDEVRVSGGRSRDHSGTFVAPGVDTCLYESSETNRDVLNRVRLKYGLPKKDEKPELVIRFMCRLLTTEEAKAAKASGNLE